MTAPASLSAAGKALLIAFAVYVVAVFVYQLTLIADADYLHEEMRLLFRYHLASDPRLFGDDYIASFVAAFDQPYLYDWITRLWLAAGGELTVLHRVIPLLCWLAFLAGLAVAALRLGGRVTAIAVLGLAVVQPVYLHQITSALPHSFAFPLLAWAFVALLFGSTPGLALATLLCGLLYPALTPLVGLLFAWHVIIARQAWRLGAGRRAADLLLLAAIGGVSLWLLFDALAGPSGFGAPLAPLERVEAYPENGPQGRHFYGVFNPFAYVAAKAFDQFHDVFGNMKLLLLLVYALVSLYGLVVLCTEARGRQAVVALILCSLAVSILVFLAKPHLVYRFILYPGFILLPLLFVRGIESFCGRFAQLLRAPQSAALAVVLLFALSLDGIEARKLGYWWHLEPESAAVIDFAVEQPPGTLFAVWPQSEGGLEYLPYLARRPVFVLQKAHYPTYEKHVLEMRARMDALIEAYLASDAAPLRALHCRWGADYLVADRTHFGEAGTRPAYFAPFDARLEALWRERAPGDFLLNAPDPAFVVLETPRYRILRLAGPCEAR